MYQESTSLCDIIEILDQSRQILIQKYWITAGLPGKGVYWHGGPGFNPWSGN